MGAARRGSGVVGGTPIPNDVDFVPWAPDVFAVQKMAIDSFVSMLAAKENAGRAFGAFLMAHGRYFLSAPLPSRMRRGTVKQCYANAQKSVVQAVRRGRPPLTYVEGFACSGGLSVAIPMQHAWLVDGEGRVVDPTWEFPERSCYFGVPFAADYVVSRKDRFGGYDSLLDDRRDAWALLNDPDVAGAAVLGAVL